METLAAAVAVCGAECQALATLVRRWAALSVLSVLDQCCFSGSQLLTTLLFARWLTPDQYGAFAIAFAGYLLVANLHNALVFEPMSALARRSFPTIPYQYLVSVIKVDIVLSALLSMVILALGCRVAVGSLELGRSLMALAAASPVMLFLWLLRRIAYTLGRPALALKASAAGLAATMLALACSRLALPLSTTTPFFVFACSSAAGSTVAARALRQCAEVRQAEISMAGVLRLHWPYARWILGVACTSWCADSAFPVLAGAYLGLSVAATLRVAETLVFPFLQVIGALTLLFLPHMSVKALTSPSAAMTASMRAGAWGAAIAAGYAAVVILMGGRFLSWFYPHGQYSEVTSLLPLFGAALAIRAATDLGVSTLARALGRADAIFWASVVGAITNLTLGIRLIKNFHLVGAASARLLATVVQSAVILIAMLWLHHCEKGVSLERGA